MGMVVRTNMMAINANRNLGKNNKGVSGSLEKLASGFRINRAGDDASGLAISEKMKAQIKALGTASDNCEDGISLIQTAEGYMTEIHDMLNRMVELSEKSANGINEDSGNTGVSAYGVSGGVQNAGTDRAALQAEMDQLSAEIDRIAMTANFNGNKLLNGALDKNTVSIINEDGTASNAAGKVMTFQIGETSNKADKLCVNIKRMTTDRLFSSMKSQTVISADGSTALGNQNLTIKNGAALRLQRLLTLLRLRHQVLLQLTRLVLQSISAIRLLLLRLLNASETLSMKYRFREHSLELHRTDLIIQSITLIQLRKIWNQLTAVFVIQIWLKR